MLLAQRRDNLSCQGTNLLPKFTLSTLSNDDIVVKVNSLGVSLGKDNSERRAAANLIIDEEANRSIILLKKKEESVDSHLLVSHISTLCEDLVDEHSPISEDLTELGVQCAKVSRTRHRKSYDKTNVRRSTRIRIKSTKAKWLE